MKFEIIQGHIHVEAVTLVHDYPYMKLYQVECRAKYFKARSIYLPVGVGTVELERDGERTMFAEKKGKPTRIVFRDHRSYGWDLIIQNVSRYSTNICIWRYPKNTR